MKTKILTLFLLCIIQFKAAGQEPCTYAPLQFEELSPIWRHYVIDSSMIGYQAPDPADTYAYAGYNHLSWDIGSFVEGDFLYEMSEINISGDYAGAHMEKIDINTGELMWQINNDIRTSEYREKVLDARVEKDVFIVSGIREDVTDDVSISIDQFFFAGKLEGKIFERKYDLETGDQISYITPSQEDSLAYNLFFIPWIYYNYFTEGEGAENYLDARNVAEDKGTYLIRRKIDRLGRLTDGPDTLVTGRFNERLFSEAIHVGGPRFRKKKDGNFLYLEQYSPQESADYSFEAYLSEYDKDFNLVNERNLKDFGIKQFSLIQIINTDENYILLRGCYNIDNAFVNGCHSFLLVLDQDLNLLDKFDLVDSQGRQYSFLPQYLKRGIDGRHYVTKTQFSPDIDATVNILRSTSEGALEIFKKLTVSNSDKITTVMSMIILDNGDFLIKFRPSCYVDGIRTGEFREWQRIDADDFMTSIANQDLDLDLEYKILPNPFNNYLEIDNPTNTITKVEIININGMVVKTQKTNFEPRIRINTSNVEAGYYFVRLTTHQNREVSRSIVKF